MRFFTVDTPSCPDRAEVFRGWGKARTGPRGLEHPPRDQVAREKGESDEGDPVPWGVYPLEQGSEQHLPAAAAFHDAPQDQGQGKGNARGAKDVASQGETKGVFRFSCFVAMVPLLTGAFGSASVLSTRARPAPPYVGSRRRKPVQSRHSPATVRRTTCGRSPRGDPWKARTEEDSKSGYCADGPTAPSSRAEGVLLIAQGLRPKGTPSLPRRSVFCARGRRRSRGGPEAMRNGGEGP